MFFILSSCNTLYPRIGNMYLLFPPNVETWHLDMGMTSVKTLYKSNIYFGHVKVKGEMCWGHQWFKSTFIFVQNLHYSCIELHYNLFHLLKYISQFDFKNESFYKYTMIVNLCQIFCLFGLLGLSYIKNI